MGDILGSILGSGGGSGRSADLINMIVRMVGNSRGGLGGLVEQLQQAGLGDAVGSWVSTGKNLPVSPSDLGSVFSSDQMTDILNHFGGNREAANGALSELLPDVIDKITPAGNLPNSNDWMTDVGGLLGGLLKR